MLIAKDGTDNIYTKILALLSKVRRKTLEIKFANFRELVLSTRMLQQQEKSTFRTTQLLQNPLLAPKRNKNRLPPCYFCHNDFQVGIDDVNRQPAKLDNDPRIPDAKTQSRLPGECH